MGGSSVDDDGLMTWWRKRKLRVLSSEAAYARWAGSYPAKSHNALMTIEEAAMRALMPDLRGLSVLDVACGTGRYGRIALDMGAAQVIGCDNSLPMLRAAVLTERIQASSEALSLADACADVIICAMALGHLPQIDASLAEIGRVLRSGGCALISDFHPVQHFRGAQRTFRADDGRHYAIEHHPHLMEDYLKTAQSTGLRLSAIREPRFEDVPVVCVMRFERI